MRGPSSDYRGCVRPARTATPNALAKFRTANRLRLLRKPPGGRGHGVSASLSSRWMLTAFASAYMTGLRKMMSRVADCSRHLFKAQLGLAVE